MKTPTPNIYSEHEIKGNWKDETDFEVLSCIYPVLIAYAQGICALHSFIYAFREQSWWKVNSLSLWIFDINKVQLVTEQYGTDQDLASSSKCPEYPVRVQLNDHPPLPPPPPPQVFQEFVNGGEPRLVEVCTQPENVR